MAVGESRLRGLLRPLDPVPPSARLRSTPAAPGPPPSFGAPYRSEVSPEEPIAIDPPSGRRTASYAPPVAWPEDQAEPVGGPGGQAPPREVLRLPQDTLLPGGQEEWREPFPRTLAALGRRKLGRVLPRLDPGAPGLRVLVAAGALAAVVTGILAWRSRPVAEPIAPPIPVAAVRTAASAPDPGTGAEAGAGIGTSAAAYPASAIASPSSARVVVYVTGKVRRPGVLSLAPGSRVADAVAAAGGLRKGASPGGVNLARRVVDGEQVIVGSPAQGGAGAVGSGPAGTPGGDVVNLNTATVEQLDALPGVGGVIAQRIVGYRDAHGGFQSVDQLKDVPGIGERKFAEMRDKVIV